MRKVVFITGFNNWGKTTIIQDLFNNRTRFYHGWTYPMTGVNFVTQFTVESHSNDDYWGQGWNDLVNTRINNSPDNGQNLITAICPTLHTNNDFRNLLASPPFDTYDQLYLFLIEYKWEHHAKLIIENIRNSGQAVPNINFIVIDADRNFLTDADRFQAKMNQIRQELNNIFP